jgi:hypothetical protein
MLPTLLPEDSDHLSRKISRSNTAKHRDSIKLSTREVDLNIKFKYFRKEFVAAAQNAGVTVPLDMLDDLTGNLIGFVNTGGPKFVLQLFLTHQDTVNILRNALSLMIICMAFLKEKIPENVVANKYTARKGVLNDNISGKSSSLSFAVLSDYLRLSSIASYLYWIQFGLLMQFTKLQRLVSLARSSTL